MPNCLRLSLRCDMITKTELSCRQVHYNLADLESWVTKAVRQRAGGPVAPRGGWACPQWKERVLKERKKILLEKAHIVVVAFNSPVCCWNSSLELSGHPQHEGQRRVAVIRCCRHSAACKQTFCLFLRCSFKKKSETTCFTLLFGSALRVGSDLSHHSHGKKTSEPAEKYRPVVKGPACRCQQ